MKKILLAFSATAIAVSAAFAQAIPNNGFETWVSDTATLDLSQLGQAPDTFEITEPANWRTSNAITGAALFRYVDSSVIPPVVSPQKIFVTESSDSYAGGSALRLTVDTINVSLLGTVLPIPGFVASGNFDISLTSFVGSSISLTNIAGAGVPVDGRKGKLKGYYKYTPGGNTVGGAPGVDSAAAIAVLKKGATVIATAEFYGSTVATNGYVAFEAPFNYVSCEVPDSVVIVLSASNPRALEGLTSGGTFGLPLGSEVLFDEIELEDTLPGFVIPAIAVDDAVSTEKNTAVTVPVLLNDADCYGNALSVTLPSASSSKGGALVLNTADNTVQYTPATDYVGLDTFSYELNAESVAKVYVTVTPTSGIADVNKIAAAIYPNPAQSVLYVTTESKEVANAVVTDIIGQVVLTEKVSTANTAINTSNVGTGLYVITLFDANGKARFASKFVVTK